MGKIGRNEPCPCGSGAKYKKCCLPKAWVATTKTASPNQEARPVSLATEVEHIRQAAAAKTAEVRALGVFIFFSTTGGDAWLLEVSDMDGVMLTQAGEALEVNIRETPETIEVDWTHTFSLADDRFMLTSYLDKSVEAKENYPVAAIRTAVEMIKKSFSPELLNKVHLHEQPLES